MNQDIDILHTLYRIAYGLEFLKVRKDQEQAYISRDAWDNLMRSIEELKAKEAQRGLR